MSEQYFAQVNEAGLVQGFFAASVNHDIPADAIAIDEATWQAWAADTAAQRWDAESGQLVPYTPPPAPPMVPAQVTRRQMLLVLAAAEVITGDEALAAASTGAVPAAIDAVFAALSPDEALAARITWATMSIVERAHPLIAAMIAAEIVTAEQADALFVQAASL